jgi:hypothetical protein
MNEGIPIKSGSLTDDDLASRDLDDLRKWRAVPRRKALMAEFSDEQVHILVDLAAAAGSMVVSTDVVRGPLIGLWLKGLVRSNAVSIGHLELHLTETGWQAANGLSNRSD